MKCGIMQPYFFPYLGYWQLINYVDRYVVYDDVNFIKGGWINRNNILINEKASLITLPLKEASSFKKINEIDIIDNDKIKNKLLKSIELSYAKAPYFPIIMPIIRNLLINNTNIAALNYNTILEVCKYLDIDTQIILSSDIEKNNALTGEEKVIHICQLLEADTYINAIGGTSLYNKEHFLQNGIELKFLRMKDIEYPQFKQPFCKNLSIIDILMFADKNKIKDMLNEFTLI